MLRFDGGGDDLNDVFLIGHAGDIFFGGVLRIGVDVLPAHTFVADVDATGFCFGNTAYHRHAVHGIHFFVQPFQFVVSERPVLKNTVCALKHAAQTDKILIGDALRLFGRGGYALNAVDIQQTQCNRVQKICDNREQLDIALPDRGKHLTVHVHEAFGLLRTFGQTNNSRKFDRFIEVNDVSVLLHHFKLIHQVFHILAVFSVLFP